jgi:hypothetical protein
MSKRRASSSIWAGRGSGQRLEIKVRPHRSIFVQVLLALWRWRVEIVVLVVLVAVYRRLSSWLAQEITRESTFGRAFDAIVGRVVENPVTSGALLLMLLVPALLAAWGPSRRYSVRHTWCTITRHRLRLFFSEADITNRSGRLPWIVHVRPTPVGERAWVWMAPGLSAESIQDRTANIASTCWARDARITATRRVVTLVRVDIVRRDPLETTKRTRPIRNRLLDFSARIGRPDTTTNGDRPTGSATAPAPGMAAWSIRPPAATPPATPPTKSAGKTGSAAPAANPSSTPAAPSAPADPAVIIDGEDVSDYV